MLVDTAWAPMDVPFVLTIPDETGVTLDILGSDAVGIPVADGTVLRILLP